jgi:hypothetical protein
MGNTTAELWKPPRSGSMEPSATSVISLSIPRGRISSAPPAASAAATASAAAAPVATPAAEENKNRSQLRRVWV